jgi:hypothetical protein
VLYNDALSTLKDVWSDLLANVLQSNWNLSVAVDSETGASNMHDDLTDAAANIRKAIAAQLPESNFALYMDASENPITSALPLKLNDTIVFLFDTTTSLLSRAPNKVSSSEGAAAAGTSTVTNATGDNAPQGPASSDGAGAPANVVTDVTGAITPDPYGVNLVQQYNGRKDVVAFYLTVGTATRTYEIGETVKTGLITGLTAATGNPSGLLASAASAPQGY